MRFAQFFNSLTKEVRNNLVNEPVAKPLSENELRAISMIMHENALVGDYNSYYSDEAQILYLDSFVKLVDETTWWYGENADFEFDTSAHAEFREEALQRVLRVLAWHVISDKERALDLFSKLSHEVRERFANISDILDTSGVKDIE